MICPAAGPLSVTVPVAVEPLSSEDGVTVTDARSGSAKTSAACCETPFAVAVMVTVVLTTPAVVVTGNVADGLPAAMVTEAGTEAAEVLLEVSVTTMLAAAAPVSDTVPVTAVPPVIVGGESVSEASCGRGTVARPCGCTG